MKTKITFNPDQIIALATEAIIKKFPSMNVEIGKVSFNITYKSTDQWDRGSQPVLKDLEFEVDFEN